MKKKPKRFQSWQKRAAFETVWRALFAMGYKVQPDKNHLRVSGKTSRGLEILVGAQKAVESVRKLVGWAPDWRYDVTHECAVFRYPK